MKSTETENVTHITSLPNGESLKGKTNKAEKILQGFPGAQETNEDNVTRNIDSLLTTNKVVAVIIFEENTSKEFSSAIVVTNVQDFYDMLEEKRTTTWILLPKNAT